MSDTSICYYAGVKFLPMRSYFSVFLDERVLTIVIVAMLGIAALWKEPAPAATGFVAPAAVGNRFAFSFDEDAPIQETGSPEESKDRFWWLDSGGELRMSSSTGATVQGDIPEDDPWYAEYRDTNPIDTDNGRHPQNLLRLVTRSTWKNVRTEASFYIAADNLSPSENRNESNGLLLMFRYGDSGQTLYYAGIRVDGTAVIKKKYKGTYYTMAQSELFPGIYSISKKRGASQNLLPHGAWIRLRGETITDAKGAVTVRLYIQNMDTQAWELLLSADDNGQYDGTPPITAAHPVGIRTDFMDVQFKDFLAEAI